MHYAIRSFSTRPSHLLASVGAVALAVALTQVMLALMDGTVVQYASYAENANADIFVAQRGVSTLLQPSLLPAATVDEIARVRGVATVAGIYGQVVTLTADGRSYPAYLLGYDSEHNLGGPADVAWGSFKRGGTLDRGEAIVDAALAERLDLRPGDAIAVPGRTLQIAGIAHGVGGRYAYVFVTREDAALLLGLPERYNYALVETAPDAAPVQVAAAINDLVPAVSAYDRQQFARNATAALEDTVLPAMRLMLAVGLLVGTIVIGLMVYASVLDRQREFATIKAMGASNLRLYRFTLLQALISAILGFAVGLVLTALLALLLPRFTPTIGMRLQVSAILAGLVMALAMACLAAVVPVRRLARIDPALAFRG